MPIYYDLMTMYPSIFIPIDAVILLHFHLLVFSYTKSPILPVSQVV